ncbi:alpha/beta hydrolase family protein [Hymenobacter sp. HDW8]|uniref:alpha/beta hydrolase family protein n=1 Tax=Hymenobacter sp. HDW8 TaxID=2714932 RepID=UPI00140826C2|nr:alpha/beta fold hydrolase [Hymenobacter sp. HDW8]QIL76801.1 alpha/beta fold hydrolase [Hymenobacter sp. HDW8]
MAAPARAAAPALDGLWKGPLPVPGGQLEVVFRVVALTGGSFFATLDVPQQKISRMAVSVEVRGDTIVFMAPEAGSQFMGLVSADGKALTGTWQQPGYQVALTLGYTSAPISTAKSARLTPPYREEEIAVPNTDANLTLGGMLTVPAGEGPFPAVVLISDMGAQDRDATVGDYRPMGALADFLTRRGIAVLRFDDRGVGKSGGDYNEATPPALLTDLQAAMRALRSRPEINAAKVGVVGHGEGGNLALLAAADEEAPNFVVTMAASGISGRDLVLQQQADLYRSLGASVTQMQIGVMRRQAILDVIRQTPDNAKAQRLVAIMLRETNPSIDMATAKISAGLLTTDRYRYFLDFNPADKLPSVKCPVLLLSGTADTYIEADVNLNSLQKGLKSSSSVNSRKLPGVNHMFQADPSEWTVVNGQPQPTFSPQAQEAIRQWIIVQATEKAK